MPNNPPLPWTNVEYYCRTHGRPVLALQYFLPGIVVDPHAAPSSRPAVKGVCSSCLRGMEFTDLEPDNLLEPADPSLDETTPEV